MYLIIVPVIFIITNILVDLASVIFFGKNDYVKKDAAHREVVVNTKHGRIKGRTLYTTYKRLPYYSFRGIPYAQAPIMDLRFKVHNLTYFKKQRRTKFAERERAVSIFTVTVPVLKPMNLFVKISQN